MFYCVASSPTTIKYQWFKNNVAIPDATEFSLTLGPIETSDAGFYKVQATSGGTTITSRDAKLTVTIPRTIPRLSNVILVETNHLSFQVDVDIRSQVIIEFSKNLKTWVPLYTNTTPGTLRVPIPAEETFVFYRAIIK